MNEQTDIKGQHNFIVLNFSCIFTIYYYYYSFDTATTVSTFKQSFWGHYFPLRTGCLFSYKKKKKNSVFV